MNFHSSVLQVASIIKNKDQIKAKEKQDIEKKKRDRKANYSTEETNRLVDIILLKKDILGCKKNNADQWNEKREAWDYIEREFNKKPKVGSIYRDSKDLKIKYESLKRDVKRKWNNILANRKNSNGRVSKFTAAEKKIKDIILLPMEGICDFDSIDDTNEIKSDDEDSNDSSVVNSNIEDVDCSASTVKKEEVVSDDESAIHFEEPPLKIMRHDPLVGPQLHQSRIIDKNDVEAEKLKKKLEIEMLKEELEIKKLQRKTMEQELAQKITMHELEKEHLLLKIKALRNQIE